MSWEAYPVEMQNAVMRAFKNPGEMVLVAGPLPERGTPGVRRTIRTVHEKALAMMRYARERGTPFLGLQQAIERGQIRFVQRQEFVGRSLFVWYDASRAFSVSAEDFCER